MTPIKPFRFVFGRDREDGGFKVLSVPAEPRPDYDGCGHTFDCCGCTFPAWYRRGFAGLWSITAYWRNI